MHPTISIAKRAALAAGRVILHHFERADRLTVRTKALNDLVTEADTEAERKVVETIHRYHPDHAILAEEAGPSGDNTGAQWIIDPLDGTTNFVHGLPHFAVSIAFRSEGRLESGLVYNPISQEMFVAARGRGAHLNERRIRVSGRVGLEGALLGTGFPFRAPQYLPFYQDAFAALFRRCGEMRRTGAAALDLAYVASGRLDGFWEIGLREWDLAAGALLVQEAGGLVGDFVGGHNHFKTGNVVAGSPKVFKGMIQTIRPLMRVPATP